MAVNMTTTETWQCGRLHIANVSKICQIDSYKHQKQAWEVVYLDVLEKATRMDDLGTTRVFALGPAARK